jgi:hypothetical protein
MAEIDLALIMGDTYVQKIWLYGHYLKSAPDADFAKYGLPESLNFSLKNQTTTTFARHMPVGNYLILDLDILRLKSYKRSEKLMQKILK